MYLKKAFVVLSLSAALLNVHADYETLNLFGSVGAGFGLGGQSSLNGDRFQSEVTTATNTSVEDHFFNYGNGLKLNVGCQYFFMENVAVQPSFTYSAGIPVFKFEDKNEVTNTTTSYKHNFNLFGIKLQVVPRFEILDIIDMYTGVGLGFFWNTRSFEIKTENSLLSTSTTSKGKISSKPTFGFTGTLGADYPLNDRLTLFAELGFEQLRFNLKELKYTDGPNEGDSFDFKKDTDQANYYDPEKVPGANIQINIGIRFGMN